MLSLQVFIYDFISVGMTSSRPRQVLPICAIKFRKTEVWELELFALGAELTTGGSIPVTRPERHQNESTPQSLQPDNAMWASVVSARSSAPAIQSGVLQDVGTMSQPSYHVRNLFEEDTSSVTQSNLPGGLHSQQHHLGSQSRSVNQQYYTDTQPRLPILQNYLTAQSELLNQQHGTGRQSEQTQHTLPVQSRIGQNSVARQHELHNRQHHVAFQSALNAQYNTGQQNQQYPSVVQPGQHRQQCPVAYYSGPCNQQTRMAMQARLHSQQDSVVQTSRLPNGQHSAPTHVPLNRIGNQSCLQDGQSTVVDRTARPDLGQNLQNLPALAPVPTTAAQWWSPGISQLSDHPHLSRLLLPSAYQMSRQFLGQPLRQQSGQLSSQPPGQLSGQSSCQRSSQPSVQLSSQSLCQLSGQQSGQPSGQVASQTLRRLSEQLSTRPSGQLLSQPLRQLSGQPSGQLSSQPPGPLARQPSGQQTSESSCQRSSQPSVQLTRQPLRQLSGQPSGQLSTQPSGQLSSQALRQLLGQPSGQPSGQVSSQPSCQLSDQLSSQPSSQMPRQLLEHREAQYLEGMSDVQSTSRSKRPALDRQQKPRSPKKKFHLRVALGGKQTKSKLRATGASSLVTENTEQGKRKRGRPRSKIKLPSYSAVNEMTVSSESGDTSPSSPFTRATAQRQDQLPTPVMNIGDVSLTNPSPAETSEQATYSSQEGAIMGNVTGQDVRVSTSPALPGMVFGLTLPTVTVPPSTESECVAAHNQFIQPIIIQPMFDVMPDFLTPPSTVTELVGECVKSELDTPPVGECERGFRTCTPSLGSLSKEDETSPSPLAALLTSCESLTQQMFPRCISAIADDKVVEVNKAAQDAETAKLTEKADDVDTKQDTDIAQCTGIAQDPDMAQDVDTAQDIDMPLDIDMARDADTEHDTMSEQGADMAKDVDTVQDIDMPLDTDMAPDTDTEHDGMTEQDADMAQELDTAQVTDSEQDRNMRLTFVGKIIGTVTEVIPGDNRQKGGSSGDTLTTVSSGIDSDDEMLSVQDNWTRFLTDDRFQPVVMLDKFDSVPHRPASSNHVSSNVTEEQTHDDEICRTSETQMENTESTEDDSDSQKANASKGTVHSSNCRDAADTDGDTDEELCNTEIHDLTRPVAASPGDTDITDNTCSVAQDKTTLCPSGDDVIDLTHSDTDQNNNSRFCSSGTSDESDVSCEGSDMRRYNAKRNKRKRKKLGDDTHCRKASPNTGIIPAPQKAGEQRDRQKISIKLPKRCWVWHHLPKPVVVGEIRSSDTRRETDRVAVSAMEQIPPSDTGHKTDRGDVSAAVGKRPLTKPVTLTCNESQQHTLDNLDARQSLDNWQNASTAACGRMIRSRINASDKAETRRVMSIDTYRQRRQDSGVASASGSQLANKKRRSRVANKKRRSRLAKKNGTQRSSVMVHNAVDPHTSIADMSARSAGTPTYLDVSMLELPRSEAEGSGAEPRDMTHAEVLHCVWNSSDFRVASSTVNKVTEVFSLASTQERRRVSAQYLTKLTETVKQISDDEMFADRISANTSPTSDPSGTVDERSTARLKTQLKRQKLLTLLAEINASVIADKANMALMHRQVNEIHQRIERSRVHREITNERLGELNRFHTDWQTHVLPDVFRLRPELENCVSVEGQFLFLRVRPIPLGISNELYSLKVTIESVYEELAVMSKRGASELMKNWQTLALGWLHTERRKKLAEICHSDEQHVCDLADVFQQRRAWYR